MAKYQHPSLQNRNIYIERGGGEDPFLQCYLKHDAEQHFKRFLVINS